MNRFAKAFALLLCLIPTLTACGSEQTGNSPEAPPPTAPLSWTIYDPYSKFSGNWNQYSLLRSVTQDTDLSLEIEVVSEDIDIAVSKRLLSGEYPDMMTFLLEDDNLQKAAAVLPHSVFAPGDSLYESIDPAIRDFHTSADGALHYIPGGFSAGSDIANEGVYVYDALYRALSTRPITELSDLPAFVRAYLAAGEDAAVTDILLFDQRGFHTLEHLFGIAPSKLLQFTGDIPDAGDFKPIFSLLSELNRSGAGGSMISYSADRTPLIFIGSAAAVECLHADRGRQLYTALDISGGGFLSCYSDYGRYATFVTDRAVRDDCTALLKLLLSEDASRTMMYGEQNVNWLLDEQNNTVTPIRSTAQQLTQGDAVLLQRCGITVFPYLSSVGATYPGSEGHTDTPLRDTLREEMELCGDPTQEPARSYREKENALMEYYALLLSQPDRF